LTRRILTGNQAVALGSLAAGVKVAVGYPGTPSTGCVTHLLSLDLPGRHVEWSTNEKVAFEIASGAAWAGQRALVTMKMSGVNVAYDALISIAYSGVNGGLVIYVADDPGVTAGMAEQDTRGFALLSDLPILEPVDAADAYHLTQEAFELSEAVGAPVFLRLTTTTALAHATIECPEMAELTAPPPKRPVLLEKDIAKYTKAGSAICREQHGAAIQRLEAAGTWIREHGLNRLSLSSSPGGLGIVSAGPVTPYVTEALDRAGIAGEDVSVLHVASSHPSPRVEAKRLLNHCDTLLILEELEPYTEREVALLAHETGFSGRIVGKLDGTLSRIGEYGVAEVLKGLQACGKWPVARGEISTLQATSHEPQATNRVPTYEAPKALREADVLPAHRPITVCAGAGQSTESPDLTGEAPSALRSSTDLVAPRPITVCAGCPHRGTYLAIEEAIRQAGLSKDEVMVTGDIGCTILGMNPPFNLLWTEVSMGSSLGIAQGYAHAGLETPVIATIGDSTFFHGGLAGLVNAIQHGVPLTLVVLDNGWTAMTGMQVNPGTDEQHQAAGRRIDLEAVVRGVGPDAIAVVDPYDLEATTAAVSSSIQRDGVSVVIAQRECAIQAARRRVRYGHVTIDPDACILCKNCLRLTGCPALTLGERAIEVDHSLCNGCGICAGFCPTGAIRKEPA